MRRAWTVALAFALACTAVTPPRQVEPAPRVSVAPEARLPFRVRLYVDVADPYLRVERRVPVIDALQWFPFIGEIAHNLATSQVQTLQYDEAFEAAAGVLAGGLFAGIASPGSSTERTAEIRLARTLYDPPTGAFGLRVTFRLLGRLGTVLHQRVVTAEPAGDLRQGDAIVNEAIDEAMAELVASTHAARAQIVEAADDDGRTVEQLEERLLALARRIGHSPAQRPEIAGRRFAVVIGISDYRSPKIEDLNGERDALDFFRYLNDPENLVNVADRRAVLLTESAATAANIRSAFADWLARRVDEDADVLIYFAGHGTYAERYDGTGGVEKYFLPFDYDADRDPYQSAIPMQELVQYFGRLDARSITMIFDACHSGAVSPGQEANELDRFTRMGGAFRTNFIVAAAAPEQKSFEYGRRGIFTESLLRGFDGEADADADGFISAHEISGHLSRQVPELSLRRVGLRQDPRSAWNDVRRAIRLPLFSRRASAAR